MIYKLLLAKFGRDKYIMKIVEELNELAVAVLHYRDDKVRDEDVETEIADVLIQIEKIFALYPEISDDRVFKIRARKLKQLEEIVK